MLASQRLFSEADAAIVNAGGALIYEFATSQMDFFAAPGALAPFNMPTLASGFGWLLLVNRLFITARDGSVTTGPVVPIGNNVTQDNFFNSAAPLAATTTIKNNWLTPFGTPVLATPDASAGPLVARLGTAAVAGTATVFKGRFLFTMTPIALAP